MGTSTGSGDSPDTGPASPVADPPDAAPALEPSDTRCTVAEAREWVRLFNAERDWGQYHSPRNLAMALSVEVGELMELFLWSADGGPQPPVASRAPKVADEAADVFICLLNFCNAMGIDLTRATADKLRRNAEKYPVDKARGRLEKSTELD